MRQLVFIFLSIIICLFFFSSSSTFSYARSPSPPLPHCIIDIMLHLGKVSKETTVFDLGTGEGRVAIAASFPDRGKAKKVIAVNFFSDGEDDESKLQLVKQNAEHALPKHFFVGGDIPKKFEVVKLDPSFSQLTLLLDTEFSGSSNSKNDHTVVVFVTRFPSSSSSTKDHDEIGRKLFSSLQPGARIVTINNPFPSFPARTVFSATVGGRQFHVLLHIVSHEHHSAIEHDVGEKLRFKVPIPPDFHISNQDWEESFNNNNNNRDKKVENNNNNENNDDEDTQVLEQGKRGGGGTRRRRQAEEEERAAELHVKRFFSSKLDPKQNHLGVLSAYSSSSASKNKNEDDDDDEPITSHCLVSIIIRQKKLSALRFQVAPASSSSSSRRITTDFEMRVKKVGQDDHHTSWVSNRGPPVYTKDAQTGKRHERGRFEMFNLHDPISVASEVEIEMRPLRNQDDVDDVEQQHDNRKEEKDKKQDL